MRHRAKTRGHAISSAYLTPEQVAARLQVSREYVYRELLGHANGIPALKLGSGLRARWRIRPEDVEAWEDRHRVFSDPPVLTRRLPQA